MLFHFFLSLSHTNQERITRSRRRKKGRTLERGVFLPERVSRIQAQREVKIYGVILCIVFFTPPPSDIHAEKSQPGGGRGGGWYNRLGVGAGISSNGLVFAGVAAFVLGAESPPPRRVPPTITDVRIVFSLKVYNCCVLTAAIVAESQLCLIDCDCDWQKLGSIVWPLVLSRLRSPAKPAARRKREEDIGSWVFGVEPLSDCRQPIPLEQLSGLIAPKKKDRKAAKLTSCLQNRWFTGAAI